MVNIVLFGPPGAGKGTQAARLAQKYGFNHISTGEIIRREIREDTSLGRRCSEYIDGGNLVPDELVIDMIVDYVAAHKDARGNIFDGFPRTTRQAEEFDRILEEHGLKVDVMLSLDVPDDELIARILLRGRDSGRSDDADLAVIRNRIDVYKAQTAVVAQYYAAQDKYVSVPGVGTIEEIFERLCRKIDALPQ